MLLASKAKLPFGAELPWKYTTMRVISLVSFTHWDTLQFSRKQGNPSSLPLSAPVSAAHCIFSKSPSQVYLACFKKCKLKNCITFAIRWFFSAVYLLFDLLQTFFLGEALKYTGMYLWLHISISVSCSILFRLSQHTLPVESSLKGVSMTTLFNYWVAEAASLLGIFFSFTQVELN